MKNNGPKIEPCGIPVLISNNSKSYFHIVHIENG